MPFDESPAVRRINALCSPRQHATCTFPPAFTGSSSTAWAMSCNSKTSSAGAD